MATQASAITFIGTTGKAYDDGMAFARAVGMLPAMGSGAENAMEGAFNLVTGARKRLGL